MRSAYRIVSDHYAASSRGDLAGMLADMDERTEWTEMAGFPLAGTYVGAAAIGAGVFRPCSGTGRASGSRSSA